MLYNITIQPTERNNHKIVMNKYYAYLQHALNALKFRHPSFSVYIVQLAFLKGRQTAGHADTLVAKRLCGKK